ncbi:PAS domain-containing sensor histidine kinase [Nitrincola tapanii]|uniref:histidine kinase n=1 Tax=Nitrincola tapanii TaxID=1708751 RepID=A0A5A9W0J6_9GAMM|nr:PAS domain-containing sensor histidine kinase [Nitrincola tapanii]KAA0874083.1 PAS domain-containing sensor histidine kinase [Nitrincola tapanii]
MAFWRNKKHAPKKGVESFVECPAQLRVGTWIELDTEARLTACSEDLKTKLPAGIENASIQALLLQPAPWLQDLPLSLTEEAMDCVLRGRESPIYLRLHRHFTAQGFCLQGMDVSDLMSNKVQMEKRHQLFQTQVRWLERLQGIRFEALQACLTEQLSEMRGLLKLQHVSLGWHPTQSLVNQSQALTQLAQPIRLSVGDLSQSEPAQLSLSWMQSVGEITLDLEAVQALPNSTALKLSLEPWILSLFQVLQRFAWQEKAQAAESLLSLKESEGWRFAPKTQRFYFLESTSKRLGLPESLSLEAWCQQLAAVDQEPFRLALSDVAAEGGQQRMEIRLKQAETWHRFEVGFMRSPDHQLLGYVRDIETWVMQRQTAQEAVRRLESLLDSAPAIIYTQTYAEGVLQLNYASASLVSVLGWHLSDWLVEGVLRSIHPDDRAIWQNRSQQLYQQGYVQLRYRMSDVQGRYHWLLDEARLHHDELGMPKEVTGIWVDITDAVEASTQLQKSEERYRVLVEDAPALICRYRPDFSLTYANALLIESLGLPGRQIEGFVLTQALPDDLVQAFEQRLQQLTPEHPVLTSEFRIQRPNVQDAWWIWSERGLFDEQGQLREIQAIGRDNTELYLAREQLFQGAKMALLGEMATGLAHEINQPLNVIRMAVTNSLRYLTKHALQDEYLEGKLQRISDQALRAAKIIDHMRVFGRKSAPEPEVFLPGQAVADALMLVQELLPNDAIQINTQALGEMPAVLGFPDHLEQVLINLLINARDALLGQGSAQTAPAQEPKIALSSRCEEDHLIIEVLDNAGGVPEHLLERIFDPFMTTKPPGQGTGLGLSVSFSLIQAMGGCLSVRNRLWTAPADAETSQQVGACFSVSLRLAPEPQHTDLESRR